MTEKKISPGLLAAAVTVGCIFPPAIVAAAAVGIAAGGATGLYRMLSRPLADKTRKTFESIANLSAEGREAARKERERQQLLFDSWLAQLSRTQKHLRAQDLQKIRLSLVLLHTAYPDLHERLPQEVMQRLIEEYVSEKDPESDWDSRAKLLEQSIVRIVNPEFPQQESLRDATQRLYEEHQERLRVLEELKEATSDEEYHFGAQVEQERNRFRGELDRLNGFDKLVD